MVIVEEDHGIDGKFGSAVQSKSVPAVEAVNRSPLPGLQVEDDDITKGISNFQSPAPIANGRLGHIDASDTSVGHFEGVGHGLNSGVDLHPSLDVVGKPNVSNHSLVRSKAHERTLLIEDSLAFLSIKSKGSPEASLERGAIIYSTDTRVLQDRRLASAQVHGRSST